MPHRRATSSEISQAVKEIPTLIVEEFKKNSTHPEEESPRQHDTAEQKSSPIYKSPLHSKRWMAAGVIGCTLCIFAFWVVYISNTIAQNKETLNPTKSFTDSGQEDLSMLISTFTRMEEKLKGTIKSPGELKAMVVQALLPMITASSTTSTAPITTTTSSTSDQSPENFSATTP